MKKNIKKRNMKKRNMKKRNIRLMYWSAALIAILVAVLSIKGTAYCMEKPEYTLANDSYTEALEDEYVANVEAVLGKCGCGTAGVMLTKVMYADGHNDYTLSINHKKLKKEGMVKNEILSMVDDVEFPVENSTLLIMTMD